MISSTRPHHHSKVQPKKSNHHRLTQYKNSSLRQKKLPKTQLIRKLIDQTSTNITCGSSGDTRKRKNRRRSEISTKRENQHTETYLPQDLLATVEVLSGLPPLDLRFSYLNRRFLISTFSKGSDTLRGRLQWKNDEGVHFGAGIGN
jgi:hypothetical protein